jgi:hypothetical protein
MTALDQAMREGIRELARQRDPLLCTCYSITDNNGVLHPVLCQMHRDDLHQLLGGFHWVEPKYQRYFETERDALDRARIILDRWPSEGYGTTVPIFHISRWWLLRANWSSSCE